MRILQWKAQVELDIQWRHGNVVGAERALAAVHASSEDDRARARSARRPAARFAKGTAHPQSGNAQGA